MNYYYDHVWQINCLEWLLSITVMDLIGNWGFSYLICILIWHMNVVT